MLQLSDDTDMYKNVLVECIGDTGYQSLPLHSVSSHICDWSCDGLGTKCLLIPGAGVHMLLGNNFAGGQVSCVM